MTWGLPPKLKSVQKFEGKSNKDIIPSLEKVFQNENFNTYDVGPYNLKAKKNLGFTFISFFAFTKVSLNTFCLVSEDGQVTIEMTYDYNSPRASTFFDRGITKKNMTRITEELNKELNS